MIQPPALELHGLSKTFGGARALDAVDLVVAPGEVHGLLGQNGSGKSTLIKVLAGYHAPDPGATMRMHGRDVALPLAPGRFRDLGLAFVHQHLGLIPDLTVAENLRLFAFAAETRLRIDWRAEAARAGDAFDRYGLHIDPEAPIRTLSQVQRCMVAIVRAAEEIMGSEAGGRGVLVLDEPTPFLPRAGVDQLFDLVRKVVAGGASVIFVSHDIDEVLRITDRATVLRDGQVVGSVVTAEADHHRFVELIVGRSVTPFHISHEQGTDAPVTLVVEGLQGETVGGLSLVARRGEVVGLTGLIGSGYDEVPALLAGAAPARAGRMTVDETSASLPGLTPRAAMALGMAYLPADRLALSGAGSLSVADNMALPSLERFVGGIGLDLGRLMGWSNDLVARHDVRPRRADAPLATLSGGNQQKALLAKWLETAPRVLLLDEPTQGVDVGARQQIYAALDAAVKAGTTVICASTDYEQLEQICDRVLVLAQGRVTAELSGAALTHEAIAERCYLGASRVERETWA